MHYIVGRGTNRSAHMWILEQMHVHFGRTGSFSEGSEHYLKSVVYPLEVHLVHYNAAQGRSAGEALRTGSADALLVISVMAALGDREPGLLTAMAHAAQYAQARRSSRNSTVNFGGIAAATSGGYFAYRGGLTTPGCHEQVTWVVLADPIAVTRRTLHTLKAAPAGPATSRDVRTATIGGFGNFRPLQRTNGRPIFSSTGDTTACATPPDPYVCAEGHHIHKPDPTAALIAVVSSLLVLCCVVPQHKGPRVLSRHRT